VTRGDLLLALCEAYRVRWEAGKAVERAYGECRGVEAQIEAARALVEAERAYERAFVDADLTTEAHD
jgi:hypothetical protein